MEIQTTIHKSVYGGDGLAFHEGMAIFIPQSIPGEQVRIELVKKKKDYGIGNIIQIEEPSSDRVTPECPNFGLCGGCSYLHMNYERELQEKVLIIKDSLNRIARLPEEDIPAIDICSSRRFRYRSHASIKADTHTAGFYQRSSQNIVPLPAQGCLLLDAGITQGLQSLKSPPHHNFKIAIDYSNNCHFSEKEGPILMEKVAGIMYKRDLYSFFQANQFLRESMLEKVAAFANLKGDETVVDLGCGVGFFTLYMSHYCTSISGYDINPHSISLARENSRLNECSNTIFKAKKISDIQHQPKELPLVIVDPPRSGLDNRARQVLQEMSPEKIVYISCNPTTWSRDIKDLLHQSYSLKKMAFIDMFPATFHIELISLLERKR